MNSLLLIFNIFVVGDALRLSTAPDPSLHNLPASLTTEDAHQHLAKTDQHRFLMDFSLFDRLGNRMKSDTSMNMQPPRDVDVWLHMSHSKQSLDANHFSPVLATMFDGFTYHNAVTKVVGQQHNAEMLQVFPQSVATGKKPTLISVGVQYASNSTIEATKKFSEMGVFVILYQTEPGMQHVLKIIDTAVNTGAREIWDYSLANVAKYNVTELAKHNLKVRFVPPGYVKDLEVGVDLESPDRDESRIAFLGNWKRRNGALRAEYQTNLNGTLFIKESGVYEKEQIRKYLSTYPVQLDVHGQESLAKRRGYGGEAMEAFRLAPLATNKACIIAAPIPEDEEVWADIVHYAQPKETLAMFTSLQQDIKGCQLRTYKNFKEKMTSAKILQNSGFLEVWNRM